MSAHSLRRGASCHTSGTYGQPLSDSANAAKIGSGVETHIRQPGLVRIECGANACYLFCHRLVPIDQSVCPRLREGNTILRNQQVSRLGRDPSRHCHDWLGCRMDRYLLCSKGRRAGASPEEGLAGSQSWFKLAAACDALGGSSGAGNGLSRGDGLCQELCRV